jgi:hypothetical protein
METHISVVFACKGGKKKMEIRVKVPLFLRSLKNFILLVFLDIQGFKTLQFCQNGANQFTKILKLI